MCGHTEYAEILNSGNPDDKINIPTGRWLLGKICPIRYDYMLERYQAGMWSRSLGRSTDLGMNF